MNLNDFDLKQGQRKGEYPAGGRLDLPYTVVLPYISIDGGRIESELMNHAAKYAYLAYFIAEAKSRTHSLKNDIDAMKGALFLDAKSNTQVKMTDEMSKAMAQQDETLMEMRRELADAEAIEVYWQNIMFAMQQRGFLLKELANRDYRERTAPNALNNFNDALASAHDGHGGFSPDDMYNTLNSLEK